MAFNNDDNILESIGSTVLYKTGVLWNLQSITNITETITGLTVNKTVSKIYRYSFDGVQYSDWDVFNLTNVSNAINGNLTAKKTCVIEISYERTGTDNTGTITIDGIVFAGTYYPSDTLKFPVSSINYLYKEFVHEDDEVFNMMINLTKKMYEIGIIPAYLVRKENTDNINEDNDYVEFWSTIAKMLCIIYEYSKQFTDIYNNKDLLCEYIRQKTIQLCNCDSLQILQYLAKYYFDEIRQRGTIEIFRHQNYEYPIGYRNSYDLPVNYDITEQPLYINDIRYQTIDDLPFGWLVDTVNDKLIVPDLNYYLIQVPDVSGVTYPLPSGFDYSFFDDLDRILVSTNPTVLDPTHFSDIKRKYHGEYLRLLCYSHDCDVFMFSIVNRENIGWNISNSSPLWKGLRNHNNNGMIVGYETFSQDVWDLLYYPIIGNGLSVETFLIKHDNTDLIDKNPDNIRWT